MLSVSLSTFYKTIRNNKSVPALQLGSLQRWRRGDLLRVTGKSASYPSIPEDALIDAKMASILCSISRPMFYKLNQMGMTPEPVLDGRTLRWNVQDIKEWIDSGCPARKARKRR